MEGANAAEPLDQPLPDQPPLDATAELLVPADACSPAVEPIARRVPEECFYLRTGSFENFLWLRHRTEEWGGELRRNLLSEQAVDYGLNQRLQKQLGLQETTLGDVVGPTVISDVAMVGDDTFMREGAALGILFEGATARCWASGSRDSAATCSRPKKGPRKKS